MIIILQMRMTTILCFLKAFISKLTHYFSKGHYFQIMYNYGVGCFSMDDSQGLTRFVSANRFSLGSLSKYFQEEDTLSLDYNKTIEKGNFLT